VSNLDSLTGPFLGVQERNVLHLGVVTLPSQAHSWLVSLRTSEQAEAVSSGIYVREVHIINANLQGRVHDVCHLCMCGHIDTVKWLQWPLSWVG
jgi:hypothetical protein